MGPPEYQASNECLQMTHLLKLTPERARMMILHWFMAPVCLDSCGACTEAACWSGREVGLSPEGEPALRIFTPRKARRPQAISISPFSPEAFVIVTLLSQFLARMPRNVAVEGSSGPSMLPNRASLVRGTIRFDVDDLSGSSNGIMRLAITEVRGPPKSGSHQGSDGLVESLSQPLRTISPLLSNC